MLLAYSEWYRSSSNMIPMPMTQFLMLHLARCGDGGSVAMRLLLRISGGLGFLRCRIRLQACRRDRGCRVLFGWIQIVGRRPLRGNFPIRDAGIWHKACQISWSVWTFNNYTCLHFIGGFPLTVRVNQEFHESNHQRLSEYFDDLAWTASPSNSHHSCGNCIVITLILAI